MLLVFAVHLEDRKNVRGYLQKTVCAEYIDTGMRFQIAHSVCQKGH